MYLVQTQYVVKIVIMVMILVVLVLQQTRHYFSTDEDFHTSAGWQRATPDPTSATLQTGHS